MSLLLFVKSIIFLFLIILTLIDTLTKLKLASSRLIIEFYIDNLTSSSKLLLLLLLLLLFLRLIVFSFLILFILVDSSTRLILTIYLLNIILYLKLETLILLTSR